jgi:phosphohistidine phosphatase
MKRLIVVRHAKSSEAEPGQKDFDRPLSDRGKKDASQMGQRLAGESISIDAFVSSPAKRARKTCKLFMAEYNRNRDEIIFVDRLYHAPSETFYEVISELNSEIQSVAVFGHNPGITEFVNTLTNTMHTDNMPTAGVFAVEADIRDWKEFQSAEKKFLFYEHPKMMGGVELLVD